MKRSKVFLLVLVSLVIAVGCAAAHKPDPTGSERPFAAAEKVVGDYIAAMSKGDLDTCAGLMHSEALSRLHDTLIPAIEPATQSGMLEVFLNLFAGVDTAEQLNGLSPEAFFASFVKGVLFAQPGIFDAMKSLEFKVIGTTPETDSLIHVVYRMTLAMGEAHVDEVETISLARDGDEWRLQLSRDIRGSAERIKEAFTLGPRVSRPPEGHGSKDGGLPPGDPEFQE
jgi:hypothetical protein